MLDTALSMDTKIYHMLPWEFAHQQLAGRHLRLSPVQNWSDPFEKWWCDILFKQRGGLFETNAYGQCWTTGKYDEPRWRMAAFGRSDPIVRMRTSVRSLLTAGRRLIETQSGSLYIGRVRYRREDLLLKRAAKVRAGETKAVTRTAASMLHYKRKQFQFENEVRVVWLDKAPSRSEFLIKLEVATTIDQLMISPYAEKEEVREIRALGGKLGLDVKQSAILRPPKLPN